MRYISQYVKITSTGFGELQYSSFTARLPRPIENVVMVYLRQSIFATASSPSFSSNPVVVPFIGMKVAQLGTRVNISPNIFQQGDAVFDIIPIDRIQPNPNNNPPPWPQTYERWGNSLSPDYFGPKQTLYQFDVSLIDPNGELVSFGSIADIPGTIDFVFEVISIDE